MADIIKKTKKIYVKLKNLFLNIVKRDGVISYKSGR